MGNSVLIGSFHPRTVSVAMTAIRCFRRRTNVRRRALTTARRRAIPISIRSATRPKIALASVPPVSNGRWFAARASEIAATVRSSAQRECLDFVRAERANVDAALAWCAEHDPALGLDIANGLGWAWVVLGDGVAGAARMRVALAACPEAAPEPRITGLLLAGWLEASAGDVARAERELDDALAAATTLGDEVEYGLSPTPEQEGSL